MSNKYDDIIPAILTAASAVYLGINRQGKKLKNVAKDSIHCLLEDGNKKPNRFRKKSRGKFRRKEETTV